MKGLTESVSGEWSGDVNLYPEALEKLFNEYKERLRFLNGLGLQDRANNVVVQSDLTTVKEQIINDIKFITSGKYFISFGARCICERLNLALQNAKEEYETKQSEGKSGKEMFGLAWDVKELNDLNEVGRELTVECTTLVDKLMDPRYDSIANNLANQISCFRERVVSFVRTVTKYRREPATHIVVVLISPEERNKKPYALAVQCIAYKSIKDSEVRQICNNVVKEMTVRQMKVAG